MQDAAAPALFRYRGDILRTTAKARRRYVPQPVVARQLASLESIHALADSENPGPAGNADKQRSDAASRENRTGRY
jgi:hypothetical protein